MVCSNWQYLDWSVADTDTGRSWTIGELRSRDFESLHQLWWVCVKERNRLATEKIERKRIEAGYGDHENQQRDKTVQETMKAILDTLAERHQAYQEAFELAKRDPSIDLSRTDGPQYEQTPYVCQAYLEDGAVLTIYAGPIRTRTRREQDTVRESTGGTGGRIIEGQYNYRTRTATEGEGNSINGYCAHECVTTCIYTTSRFPAAYLSKFHCKGLPLYDCEPFGLYIT